MDSSYWEQLQYTGDTRLEMLISYAVSGDARLAEQAIDAFAESDADGGLVQGAIPRANPMSSPRSRSPGSACCPTGSMRAARYRA